MPDMKHFMVLAYSPVDDQFKPIPVKNFKQVFDALQQWFAYKQPIIVAYRVNVISFKKADLDHVVSADE